MQTRSNSASPLLFRLLLVASLVVLSIVLTQAAPPKAGSTAADFELSALDGSKVKLSKALQKSRVVLIVLRGYPGYQCPLCTTQYGDLRSKAEQFAAAKAQVILVYPGPSTEVKQRAGEFIQDKALPANFQLLLDPDYTMIKKYGLRWDAPNETAYPSTFILAKKGKITFAKVSRSHGDRASATEILTALNK